MHRFNPEWFVDYHGWLEYSISNDATYCLSCYLFKDDNIHQGGGDVFSSIGFKSWNKKKSFDKHVGGPSSFHNQAKRKCVDLLRQQQSIIYAFEKQSDQVKHDYLIRLTASVNVVRLLLKQGFAFWGHDESKTSFNRDIVTACKMETIKAIIKELNGDYFALLVDESFDVSRKEQMAIVLRYVDRMGFMVERLVDIVHVKDTCASSLKKAIVDLFAKLSLSLSYVRGQCYDGASNMQGELNGLKMLIRQESRSAHSIHCFAHQLQLTLVAVSKKCIQVGELVVLVSNILNVLGSSFKRMDEFQESQKERIEEALDMGEFKTGRGLNQELGLSRACDTRWGSHYKSFKNSILMFGSILDVLEALVVDARLMDNRAKAIGYLKTCQTFEVAFILHLMIDVLAITNKLNKCLQKKGARYRKCHATCRSSKEKVAKFKRR
uniref:Zinc finger MYM-type protein 1-like n=1 Tax=Nicotiana tabacum TaxID=4097 RepID=A0A1S3YLK0_TOBAC|nr:PREDICTED: zinc finger MYM-type protein 1-like [Nicotiana tabacum]